MDRFTQYGLYICDFLINAIYSILLNIFTYILIKSTDVNIHILTDFRLLWWFSDDDEPAFRYLHCVKVGWCFRGT
jgi:hypothetical protein